MPARKRNGCQVYPDTAAAAAKAAAAAASAPLGSPWLKNTKETWLQNLDGPAHKAVLAVRLSHP